MSEQMPVPDAIQRLIAKFEEHREDYHSGRHRLTDEEIKIVEESTTR